jgi:hypothetical protein
MKLLLILLQKKTPEDSPEEADAELVVQSDAETADAKATIETEEESVDSPHSEEQESEEEK